MRRHLIMIIAIALVLALVSCTNDSGMNPGGNALTLKASIGAASVSASETFSEGDEVTILIKGVKFTYTVDDDGQLSSKNPYYFQSTEPVAVQGIYPAIDTIPDNSFTWKVETDQSKEGAYEGSDLLVSSVAKVSSKDPKASLAFYHQAAKIVINVKESEFLAANKLSSVEIKDIVIKGEYTLPADSGTHGTWTAQSGSTEDDITLREINFPADGYVASYEAIVIPQEIASGEKLFVFTVKGYSPFFYAAENPITWKAGKEYTYNVTIEPSKVTISSISASMDWKQGSSATGTGKLPGIREISDNYYEVSDAAGLDAWAEIARNNLAASCILASDITYDTKKEWEPIGTYDNPYTGTFDGNGKTLSNINISTSSGDYIGLFGCIGDNGTVKNLNVREIEITSKNNNYIGVIAGGNKGTIAGCTIEEATVTSAASVIGGVVGWNMNRSNITACSFQGTIDGEGSVSPFVGWRGRRYHVNRYFLLGLL